MDYPSRNIETLQVNGANVSFIASNDRLTERVRSASNEDYILDKIIELGGSGTFWDVGACFGIHSFVAADHYDRVVAFEPMPANRGALIDNMHINSIDNVHVCTAALFDEAGFEDFGIRESHDAGYGRHSIEMGDYDSLLTITVDVKRGDDLMYDVPRVVKIDVEGAEGNVIDGMMGVLSSPECEYVILETHEPNPVQPSYEDFGYTLAEIRSMLTACGFTVEQMENEYHWIGRKL